MDGPQWRTDIGLGDPVSIELPAAAWLQVSEFLKWAEIPEHGGIASPGVPQLQEAIMRSLITPESMIEHEADFAIRRAAAEAQMEAMSPAGFIKALREQFPGNEEE